MVALSTAFYHSVKGLSYVWPQKFTEDCTPEMKIWNCFDAAFTNVLSSSKKHMDYGMILLQTCCLLQTYVLLVAKRMKKLCTNSMALIKVC